MGFIMVHHLYTVLFGCAFLFSVIDCKSVGYKVLRDDQVAGGQDLRDLDHYLSSTFGGYKALQDGKIKEPTFYGKNVEPVLHAAEHTRRAIANLNAKEWARAKDAINTFGNGLHTMDNEYQSKYERKR